MKYLLALICPPLALFACKKQGQAIASTILFALAIATARYGVGAVIDFFLILWASNVAGESVALREAHAFNRTVAPIPVIRD